MASLSRRTYPTTNRSVWIVRWFDRDGIHRQRTLGDISETEAQLRLAQIIEEINRAEEPFTDVEDVEVGTEPTIQAFVEESFNPLRQLKRVRISETLTRSEIGLLAQRTTQAIQKFLETQNATLISELSQPKVSTPGENTLVVLVGDLQWGKNIPGIFNPTIAQQSMRHYTNVTIDLIKEDLPRINEIAICLVGDIVDGWSIYPGQSFHADQPVPEQVYEASNSVWEMVMGFIPFGLPITIYAVPGNHGRVHKDAHPDTNWDISAYYQLLAMSTVFASQSGIKIPVVFPRMFGFLNFVIKGHKIHMRHIGPNESATSAQYASWKQMHGWDIMICGDRHHYSIYEIHGAPVIRNSTIMPTDGFTESLGYKSVPSQLIFGVSEKHAPTFIYPIFIDSNGDAYGQIQNTEER